MLFGDKLKELRLGAGMTQPTLASAAAIGLPTLKDYEANRRVPSLEVAQRLVRALGQSCQVFDGCEFVHASRPTGPPQRRTGRKMPAHPRKRP